MRKNSYTLGASREEQERLEEQQRLYADSQFLEFAETDTVCEVGCGSGANLWVAAKIKEYIGVDIQPQQIQSCQQIALNLSLKNTNFLCADGHNLPLSNDSVDATFCRLVLIHLLDPEHVLKEMYRITRPEGRIIAIEPEVKTYHTTKPFLMKTFKIRTNYIYRPGHGSINVARNLHTLFQNSSLQNIKITKHEIFATGQDKEKLTKLLINWFIMLKIMASELIEKKYITSEDFAKAEQEIKEITESDSVYQCLWVAEGIKPTSFS